MNWQRPFESQLPPVPEERSQRLIDFIKQEVIRRPSVEVAEDTPLVSSGLIDSFALIEIFLQLQKVTNRRIPSSKVRAKDMDSVRLMLSLAERMGKPNP